MEGPAPVPRHAYVPVLPAQALSAYGYRGRAIQRGGGATRGNDSEATLSYPPLPETESGVKAIAQFFGTSPQPPDIFLNAVANETQWGSMSRF